MRLFIAIDLPEHIREQVTRLHHGLPGTRWTPPEQLHLTLRFIGDVNEPIYETIIERLAQVRFPPFQMRIRGVGQFLKAKLSQILWVGIAAEETLLDLQAQVEKEIRGTGLPGEKRAYQPHITIARIKNTPRQRLMDYVEQFSHFESDDFTVRAFYLYSSILRPEGARHHIEAEFPANS